MVPYHVEEQGDILGVRMAGLRVGWERWFLLTSDWHWDNPYAKERLLRRHFDEAVERDAGIIAIGDLLCVMQGKDDPRGSKSKVKEKHKKDDYFTAVEDDTVDMLERYKENIVGLGTGNHESAVLKHHEINLISRIAKRLDVRYLGYAGFIRFLFSAEQGRRSSRTMFYTHGDGGGGPVTRGTIDSARKAVWLPDADFVVRGHIHESWQISIPRTRVSNSGRVYNDEQLHICLPTYKDEFDMRGGYHIEKGRGPKPLGGAWMRFYYDHNAPGRLSSEVTRAK